MSMSDPIADMLTRIRNANIAKHDTVDVPSSKMKKAIADILVAEGYVKGYEVIEDGIKSTLRISLKYGETKNVKVITGLKRISKPGLRVFAGSFEDIPVKLLTGTCTRVDHDVIGIAVCSRLKSAFLAGLICLDHRPFKRSLNIFNVLFPDEQDHYSPRSTVR